MDKECRKVGCDDYLHKEVRGILGESYCKNPNVIEVIGLDIIGIAPGGKIESHGDIDYGILTSELEDFCQICPLNTSRIEDGAKEANLVKKLKKMVEFYLEGEETKESQREAESYLSRKKSSRSGDTTLITS